MSLLSNAVLMIVTRRKGFTDLRSASESLGRGLRFSKMPMWSSGFQVLGSGVAYARWVSGLAMRFATGVLLRGCHITATYCYSSSTPCVKQKAIRCIGEL